MADKIDKDEAISRVYQFLSKQKDWKADADRNGDGNVIKTEFRQYILSSNFKFNSGENKEDIIDAFWKSIDTNTTGKIGGTRISNKNALDKNEEKKIQDNIKAMELINDFVKQNLEFPEGVIDSKYKSKWKESVKSGILNQAMEFLKKNSVEALTEEKLQEFCAKSSIKAIADYKALELIDSKITSKYGNLGYKVGSDEVLSGIFDEYISKLKGTEDKDQVVKDIEAIINAYIALTTDGEDESAISMLSGYKSFDPDEINPLQETILTSSVEKAIVSNLTSTKADVYSNYKDVIDSKIAEYIKEVVNSGEDFNTIKNNIQKYVTEFMSQLTDIEKEYNELQTSLQSARSELNQYIAGILAEGDSDKNAVVQSVLGTTNATEIMNKLLAMKTLEVINDTKAQLESELKALSDRKAAEEAAKAEKYKASFGELAALLEDIQTDSLSLMCCGYATIHTEFGMDARGNIVFEQSDTTKVYNKVQTTLKQKLKSKNAEAYNAIGESNVSKLIQAAWISAYNTFNSSTRNSTSSFITEVMNRFESILNTLSEHPEYLEVYTGHTAYANSKLTTGLLHYGTNTTYGNDIYWDYSGSTAVASDGSVSWTSTPEDAAEYKVVMNQLLAKIKKTEPYSKVDQDLITDIFREAQQKALETCQNNVSDCPYATTYDVDIWHIGDKFNKGYTGKSSQSPVATANVDWSGVSRDGDSSDISVKALVELTLYYFDKLLYAQLAA